MQNTAKFDVDRLENFIDEGQQLLNNNPYIYDIFMSIIKNRKKNNVNNENENENENENDLSLVQNISSTIVTTGIKADDTDVTVNFIKKIDAYIKSFSIDELLTKPNFMLNISDKNIQDYMSDLTNKKMFHITDNSNNGIVDSTRDISKAIARKPDDNSDFVQNKRLYDVITEAINTDLVFNDNIETQSIIFRYQYLINKFFNEKIEEYKKKYSLDHDDVVFIYKGGTYMKIMYEKYINIIHDENFKADVAQVMKRSDSDYAILINKQKFTQKKDYTELYYSLNILVYNIINRITNFINQNMDLLLPIKNINTDTLKKYIAKLDSTFSQAKKSGLMPDLSKIDKIIGLSIGNATLIDEIIPDGFKYVKVDQGNRNPVNFTSNDVRFKKKKVANVGRKNFVVTLNGVTDPIYSKIIKISNDKNEYGMYQYYNETNRFSNGDKLTYFCLHRLKLNTIVYYKTTNGGYGFLKCPGELIDIPISTFEDVKTNIDIKKNIKSYQYDYKSVHLTYYSYTIYGVIEDLVKNMTVDFEYPWDDAKYLKRIKRLCFFAIVYFNLIYSNYDLIQSKLVKYMQDFDETAVRNVNLITYSGTVDTADKVYDKFINFIV